CTTGSSMGESRFSALILAQDRRVCHGRWPFDSEKIEQSRGDGRQGHLVGVAGARAIRTADPEYSVGMMHSAFQPLDLVEQIEEVRRLPRFRGDELLICR